MSLERRKKEAELARVKAARLDLEVRIEEKLQEIERLKAHVLIQIEKEKELEREMANG
jgi:hypothetical protein